MLISCPKNGTIKFPHVQQELIWHWHAVSIKPHQEYLAESNLSRLGIETFLPRIRQVKTIRRKNQVCVDPLFPGYLFARFNHEEHTRSVMHGRGVRHIVSFGSVPAIIEESVIVALKRRLCDGVVDRGLACFYPGQVVRLQDGPLFGLEAVFEKKLSGSQRAVLLLRALSYQARVVTDLKDIVAV